MWGVLLLMFVASSSKCGGSRQCQIIINECPGINLHDVGLQRLYCADDVTINWLEGTAMKALTKKYKLNKSRCNRGKKGKGSPYSINECRVPELIPVLGSQPAGDVSHKPGGKLPLLSARPAVSLATLKMAATNFAAW